MEGVVKSFSFEGQTQRCGPAAVLVLQQYHIPACFTADVAKTLLPDRPRGFSWSLRITHTVKQGTHDDTFRHVFTFTGSHAHNQFLSATYSTVTLISNTELRIRAKCEISSASLLLCSQRSILHSTSLNLSVDGSAINDQW